MTRSSHRVGSAVPLVHDLRDTLGPALLSLPVSLLGYLGAGLPGALLVGLPAAVIFPVVYRRRSVHLVEVVATDADGTEHEIDPAASSLGELR